MFQKCTKEPMVWILLEPLKPTERVGVSCQEEIELGQTPHNTEMGVVKTNKQKHSTE